LLSTSSNTPATTGALGTSSSGQAIASASTNQLVALGAARAPSPNNAALLAGSKTNMDKIGITNRVDSGTTAQSTTTNFLVGGATGSTGGATTLGRSGSGGGSAAVGSVSPALAALSVGTGGGAGPYGALGWERLTLRIQELKGAPLRELRQRVLSIYNQYLAPNAVDPLNVDSRISESIRRHLSDNSGTNLDRYCFEEAETHIFHLMKSDSYYRFLRSDYYRELFTGGKKKSKKHRAGVSLTGATGGGLGAAGDQREALQLPV
uniref:RGS domain-containing protein n=1 Tax=Echinostoma caproni TaxID=27848 RepID=A0A183AL17_9TREM